MSNKRYKVFMSYPIYDKPHPKALMARDRFISASTLCEVHVNSIMGDSDITRVRNSSISDFISRANEFDYYMTLDCDVSILTTDILDRFVRHNVDMVGCLVSKTGDCPDRLASVPIEVNPQTIKPNTGLVKFRWMGGGCTFIKKDAIIRLVNACPELTYDLMDMGIKGYALYMPMLVPFNGMIKYLSEDWALSERFRKHIGDIWGDTAIMTEHYGEKAYKVWDAGK